jgi:hypothetical protein
MNGWQQKVKAKKGQSSKAIEVKVGIPQGGPKLSLNMCTCELSFLKMPIFTGNKVFLYYYCN